MFPRALRVARLGGVDVRIDPSWVLILLLALWSFYEQFTVGRERSIATAVVMAAVAAVLFLGSVLAHELGHALEGRHRGVEVVGITLFLFGGVTEMRHDTTTPREEFVLAAVGPWISFTIAAVLGLAATGVKQSLGWADAAEVLGVVGWINLLLGVFNLIPAAPLDGGRVLRAAVWAATRNRGRAIRVAAWAGQALALVLFALAIRAVLVRPETALQALLAAVVGWFLWGAAVAERRQAETDDLVAARTVRALTVAPPPTVRADLPLARTSDLMAGSPGVDVFGVVATDDGAIVGAIDLATVMEVDPQDRELRTAGDLMRPVDDIPTIDVDAPLSALLERLQTDDLVAVVDQGTVRTLLDATEVDHALERLHDLAHPPRRRRGSGHGDATVQDPQEPA